MYEITYPLFPIAAALGFVLVLIPLPWHLEAWNSGTCYYMFWVALACLNQFVNSVVWANDAINRAPIWCDISTRIYIGAAVGIPASSLCIMRRLYSISKIQAVASTHAEKRRAVVIDTLICVLLPIIEMALAYIVQGHRFDIFEQVGCYPNVVSMLPSYFLVLMWPVLIGIISAVYCGLTLWSFLQRQAQFSQFMSSSNSTLTMSRYFRLMALAGVELLCTIPLSVFMMVLDATAEPLDPWISWEDTHFNFSNVRLIPAVLWKLNRWTVVGIQFNRWSGPFCAFVFFAFFGFASEARKNYCKVISKVLVACRLKRDPSSREGLPSLRKLTLPSSTTSSALPIYSSPPPRYQPPSVTTTPFSPDDKGFVPLASAGTVSEFTISVDEKSLGPESRTPRMLVGSLSSRASSASVVDYVV